MAWQQHPYNDIPGTYVFDGRRAHPSYAINKLLFSLNDAENRTAFETDAEAYCQRFGVEGVYREAVLSNDFLGMLRLGANIYYLAKMAVPRGVSVQDAGAAFQGISTEEFQRNLLQKGQGLESILEAKGGYWHG
ncbi:protocatechuate 3,4-dioxygenase [Halioxenophilus aromaticivorans]|uniref:Extradiol ring-cleavage dioxygenase LigAB LigA subunit domain-containing protein n=1 Tax=Halioxenophilus aromaticivorans TaxID=1306992 RepID=A0AAV3U4X9_9ALTE